MKSDLEKLKRQVWQIVETIKKLAVDVGDLLCLCLDFWVEQRGKVSTEQSPDERQQAPLTTKEAAKYLRCCTREIYKKIKEGMPHSRVGRKLLFDRNELDRWRKQNQQAIQKQSAKSNIKPLLNAAATTTRSN